MAGKRKTPVKAAKRKPSKIRAERLPILGPSRVELEPEVAERLRDMAQKRGTSPSAIIRVLLHNLRATFQLYPLNAKMGFGKYATETVESVIRVDPGYMRWAVGNVDHFQLDDQAAELLSRSLEAGVRFA